MNTHSNALFGCVAKAVSSCLATKYFQCSCSTFNVQTFMFDIRITPALCSAQSQPLFGWPHFVGFPSCSVATFLWYMLVIPGLVGALCDIFGLLLCVMAPANALASQVLLDKGVGQRNAGF